MKKVFKLENLDCAHCAGKMEEQISKLENVKSASVNFMFQKLTIEAEKEDFQDILDKSQAICSGLEKDCVIVR